MACRLAGLLGGAALGALLAGAALAQGPAPATAPGGLPINQPLPPFPGADYDPAIPALEAVTGFGFGADMTPVADIRRYFDALAAAAPDRVRLVEYGRSWEGRPLFYAVISSPRNIARLDAVKGGMRRLADPRATDAAAAEELIAGLPAVVWIAASVHGNEVGPADAALLTAYHLLAARGDARVPEMLDNAVVVINPLQNPDGRARFLASTIAARGLLPDPDLDSAERDEPWPGGRFNHYVFDLNRDWFAQTQPESRGHTSAILDWHPVVLADLHEMYTDESYFFPPAAQPTNPWMPERMAAARELIGRNNARWFDDLGLDYFTREVFDLFYPGYGDGWPSYQGAVAMTYEQGSARGLLARRSNGDMLSFADTVLSQTVAALSTVEVAAKNRQQFLRGFYEDRVQGVEEGRRDSGRFLIIPAQADRAGADKLARLLARQGIEVGRADAAFSACRAQYQPGSYVIDTAQPARDLIRVLMEPQVQLDPAFAEEQERRRARGLPDEIYDVTAWSLPLLYNLDVAACNRVDAATAPLPPEEPKGEVANPQAKLGFLVPWGDAAATRFLTAALAEGLWVKSADEGFTHGATAYPGGTLILERGRNADGLAEAVQRIAAASGARVVGVDDSWVTAGPNFGSEKVVQVQAPRIAMAWDEPTDPTAAGSARFVIERQMGWPVSAIRTDRLAETDLSRFDVVILPSGRGYMGRFGEDGAAALKGWVERGGVLIGLGGAMRFLADPDADLLSIRREDAAAMPAEGEEGGKPKPNGDGDEEGKGPTVPGTLIASAEELKAAIAPEKRPPDSVAGVLLRASVEGEHWLGAGVKPQVHVLMQGADIYTPTTLDKGVNVASFLAPDQLLASGHIWEENRRQLAFKPFVVAEQVGKGHIIGFTADPTARGFMEGLGTLLANAVFRGPAHAR